jgi:hypothetical protein
MSIDTIFSKENQMRYAKILGLLAMAAAALMAFTPIASATIVTSENNQQFGVGAKIEGKATGDVLIDGTSVVTCKESEIKNSINNPGDASSTVSGGINSVLFGNCGTSTVSIASTGSFEIHTDNINKNDGNGVFTASSLEITVLTHNIMGTMHCLYVTENTFIGTLRGSKNRSKENATLEIGSAPISRKVTDFGCTKDAEWTGNYELTEPGYMDVD